MSAYSGGNLFGVEIWASSKCPKVGETITLRATAMNRDSHPLLVELKDQPVLDIEVRNISSEGVKITRWSDGKPLTLDLTRLELQPGQSKSIEMKLIVGQDVGDDFVVGAKFIPDVRFPCFNGPILQIATTCPSFMGP